MPAAPLPPPRTNRASSEINAQLEMFAHFLNNSTFPPPLSNLQGGVGLELTQQNHISSSQETKFPVCLSTIPWDRCSWGAEIIRESLVASLLSPWGCQVSKYRNVFFSVQKLSGFFCCLSKAKWANCHVCSWMWECSTACVDTHVVKIISVYYRISKRFDAVTTNNSN